MEFPRIGELPRTNRRALSPHLWRDMHGAPVDEYLTRFMELLNWSELQLKLGLSARELQIVQLIVAGRKLSTIAGVLGLGLGTVKTYSQRVYKKLQVSTQLELLARIFTAHLAVEPSVGLVAKGRAGS